ncbi:hypothetical protein BDA96_09G256400 [Sorghum bicolor]|uniref:Uncharacterized protein n=1 Tax=Sorghum bicolor TaxID=4558 RepID=A0A921QCN4_SORBI|nr:hypothetical protein BDA96_09G256400 [Sorghum bicolor]
MLPFVCRHSLLLYFVMSCIWLLSIPGKIQHRRASFNRGCSQRRPARIAGDRNIREHRIGKKRHRMVNSKDFFLCLQRIRQNVHKTIT